MNIVCCGDVVAKLDPINRIVSRIQGSVPIAVVACCLLGGCFNLVATPESWAMPMIGRPISYLYALVAEDPESNIAKRGGIRKQGPLTNGNWMHVYPLEAYCDIYFEVDPNGIVVGFRAVGENC